MTESILQEAERLINGERQQQYGNATESHERIADLWSAYLGDVTPLTAFDVVNMMVLLKLSRAKGGLDRGEFHRDSYVDIAGYAAIGERIHNEINAGIEDGPELIPGKDLYLGERFPQWTVSEGEWPTSIGEDLFVGDRFPQKRDINWSIVIGQNEPADETPKPRQWDSLYRTPWDVQVRDAEGDLYKYDEDKGWLFKLYDLWVPVGDSKSFDNYGPFVEILEPKKPEPRVWASLGDIPEGVRFVDKDGEDDWVPEPGTTAYDEYGPFTEILDD